MPNIKDVAERAGVSRTTVSHALSGKRPVAEKTRSRILKAIGDLGYVPNQIARSLAMGTTGTIGMLYPGSRYSRGWDTRSQFILNTARVIDDQGYDFLLSTKAGLHDLSDLVSGRRVDGLIVMNVMLDDPRIDFLVESKMPFVPIGRTRHMGDLAFVDVDAEGLAHAATRHLIDLGHRQIALLSVGSWEFGSTYRTGKGYRQALVENGIPYDSQLARPTPETTGEAYRTMHQLLDEHPTLTAVITGTDMFVPAVLRTLQEDRRWVPQDFSVVALGDSLVTSMMHPSITVAEMQPDVVSDIAVRLLLQKLRGEKPKDSQILLPVNLIPRQSSAAPRLVS